MKKTTKNNNEPINESFIKLITESTDNTYIGRGNPNAKILFVGKEYSKPNENAEFDAKYWKEKIAKNERVYLKHLKRKEDKSQHTWKIYQKLYDFIFEEESTNEFNFEEEVFTTEMN